MCFKKLTKQVYVENYKIVKKKSKVLNKWKDIPYSQTGKLNIVQCHFTPNSSIFNTIPIRNIVGFLMEVDKWILKVIWKFEGPRKPKTTF